MILTAPVYKNLKKAWPDCSISLLVKEPFAQALEGNPYLDEVIPYRGLAWTLPRLKRAGFTHLLDLHANLRSFFLRRLCGAPQVLIYRKLVMARRLFVAFGWRSPQLEKHTVDKYLEPLAAWGVPVSSRSLELGDFEIPARRPPGGEREKILIVQSAFLGDTLLTLPLAKGLKALRPECTVSVLTLPQSAELFRGQPGVDEVLEDDKNGRHSGAGGLFNLSRELKGRGFDAAVIPHRSLRSAVLAWLSGIPERVGFSSSAGRLLLTQSVPFTWLMHDLERNLALLGPFKAGALAPPRDSVYLNVGQSALEELGRRLAGAGVAQADKLVGVHPGSAWPTKQWLSGRFTEVCRRFSRDGVKVVLVGGPKDAAICAEIARESCALDWSGKTSLSELRALMGRLSLFITNDSGPMHMAAASGVPTLAIFGPTTRELGFFPYGPKHRVLEADLPCRPCGLHGSRECPHGHFLCMRLISAEEVWKNAAEMLGVRAG
ncbi:MAG: lipopolysaccharide heptosyltransferase II [Elusimicrobia bacterium]|nr:lipopolysaccharide heptosyltransferase II [Elusimicrobiota bacterium]